jgi:hypothetical protein
MDVSVCWPTRTPVIQVPVSVCARELVAPGTMELLTSKKSRSGLAVRSAV